MPKAILELEMIEEFEVISNVWDNPELLKEGSV
jgi:hypothetical protein